MQRDSGVSMIGVKALLLPIHSDLFGRSCRPRPYACSLVMNVDSNMVQPHQSLKLRLYVYLLENKTQAVVAKLCREMLCTA